MADSYRADRVNEIVEASRVFRALVFAGRAARLPLRHVVERAAHVALAETGVDMLDALDARQLLSTAEYDQVADDADAVIAWMAREGIDVSFKQRDAHVAMHGRFTQRERLDAALGRLAERGVLRHELVKNSRARASDVWTVIDARAIEAAR